MAKKPDETAVLRSILAARLKKTEAGITHLANLLSTPAGIDRLLNLLYYLTTLLSPQLSRLALNLAVKLPTRIPLFVITPSSSALSTASKRCRTLASRISDVRMFMRLWGLLGMYQWGAGTLRDPPADPVVRGLILGQVAVNTCYQVLENLAYLNQHALLGFSKRTEGRMWIWSTRCWVAHITMDFIRLQRVRATRKGVVTEKEETAWRKSWLCNMTNMPLALHWGTPGGLLSDTKVGLLGLVSSSIGFRDAWRAAA